MPTRILGSNNLVMVDYVPSCPICGNTFLNFPKRARWDLAAYCGTLPLERHEWKIGQNFTTLEPDNPELLETYPNQVKFVKSGEIKIVAVYHTVPTGRELKHGAMYVLKPIGRGKQYVMSQHTVHVKLGVIRVPRFTIITSKLEIKQ